MSLTRQQVCQSAASKLAAAQSTLHSIAVTVGLDGFVDEICSVVDKRLSRDECQFVKTIEAFGRKVLAAACQSSNYELLVKQTKLGGNGPIMANALAATGMKVTCIGNLGYPDLHPVFADLATRAEIISIAQPGNTWALEFEDGKLMLGKHECLGDVHWDNLLSRVGREKLCGLIDQSRLVGMVNWTMLPDMSRIWTKLLEEVLPTLPRQPRMFFVDLADPEKRTHEDIDAALRILSRLQEYVDVILGLNLKESAAVAQVLGLAVRIEATEAEPGAGAIEDTARAIRQKLGLGCVVIHPRRGAAAATAGQSASFAGPFVAQPKISTGAGDHFNAGFCLGRLLGFGLEESLCTGVGTSGYYVRTARSPDANELAEFIAQLPLPV